MLGKGIGSGGQNFVRVGVRVGLTVWRVAVRVGWTVCMMDLERRRGGGKGQQGWEPAAKSALSGQIDGFRVILLSSEDPFTAMLASIGLDGAMVEISDSDVGSKNSLETPDPPVSLK